MMERFGCRGLAKLITCLLVGSHRLMRGKRKWTHLLLALLFANAVLSTLPAYAASAGSLSPTPSNPVLMRVSFRVTPDSPLGQGIVKWADEIERDSGGRIVVKLYPSGSLFVDEIDSKAQPPEHTNYYQVKNGRIEAAVSYQSYWYLITNQIPAVSFTLRPFSGGLESIRAFPRSETASIVNSLFESRGIHNLGYWFAPVPNIVASRTHTLTRPEDFKNERFRTLGMGMDEPITALGAIPMDIGDPEPMVAGLQNSELDSAWSGVVPNIFRFDFLKYGKFVTLMPYISQFYHVYTNSQWWAALPADLKKVIEDVTHRSEQEVIDLRLSEAMKTVEKLRADKSLTVVTMSESEAAVLRRVAQPAFDQFYLKSAGPEGRRILDSLAKQ